MNLAEILNRRKVQYALIGGLASGYRSRPRFTQDIDFILQVPQLGLPGLLNNLAGKGFEFDLETTIRQWGIEHMTVLTFRQVQVDWLKPISPIYQHVIDSAQPEDWLGSRVRIATAESLIITNLVAFRRQDQLDIENLLGGNRGQLNLDLIRKEFDTVVESDDPRLQDFEVMVTRFYNTVKTP